MTPLKVLQSFAFLTVLLILAACGSSQPPLVAEEEALPENVREGYVYLPGQSEPSLVTYEVVDGLAIMEGDIIVAEVDDEGELGTQGAGVSGETFRWPDGVVPYTIVTSGQGAVSSAGQSVINQAIQAFTQTTPIRFVPRTTETDYVQFQRGTTSGVCSSWVGRKGGMQTINTNTNGSCGLGTMIHEMAHAVGLWHEQSRADRDDYVTILWNNITPRNAFNFNKLHDTLLLGDYDYNSIMHYRATSFSSNGQPTIQVPAGITIGQRNGLSNGDIAALELLYAPLNQDSWQIFGEATQGDKFGQAVATGDFNGDGFDDLAVGAPQDDTDTVRDSGAVNIVYGGMPGLTHAHNQHWTQNSQHIDERAEAGDQFGRAVAAGDFNGDGFDDLAVGAPYDDVDSVRDAGAVNVLYGSRYGLTHVNNQSWTQNTPGIAGAAEADDHFGWKLAAGDFNGDGRSDLVISVGAEDIRDVVDAGAAHVLYGTMQGLTANQSQLWHQDVQGVDGTAGYADYFGEAVTTGDFNGDGFDDLAIGAFQDFTTGTYSGAVNVLYGSRSLLTTTGSQLWHQGNVSAATPEAGDSFGKSLSSGDFNGDGFDDLAVGVPGEDIYSIKDAGVVQVLYGTSNRLSASGNQHFHQGKNVDGAAEAGDRFGAELASGDFNNDGRDDLAIGVPDENSKAGIINVLFGQGSGLGSAQTWFWQGSGVVGTARSGDQFGYSLAAGDFDRDGFADLAVGVPQDSVGTKTSIGTVNVLYKKNLN